MAGVVLITHVTIIFGALQAAAKCIQCSNRLATNHCPPPQCLTATAEGSITCGCAVYIEQNKGGGRDLYLEAESKSKIEFWKHELHNNWFWQHYALLWNIFFKWPLWSKKPLSFRTSINYIVHKHVLRAFFRQLNNLNLGPCHGLFMTLQTSTSQGFDGPDSLL